MVAPCTYIHFYLHSFALSNVPSVKAQYDCYCLSIKGGRSAQVIGSAISWQELVTTENLFVPFTGSATMTCKMYYARGMSEGGGNRG